MTFSVNYRCRPGYFLYREHIRFHMAFSFFDGEAMPSVYDASLGLHNDMNAGYSRASTSVPGVTGVRTGYDNRLKTDLVLRNVNFISCKLLRIIINHLTLMTIVI